MRKIAYVLNLTFLISILTFLCNFSQIWAKIMEIKTITAFALFLVTPGGHIGWPKIFFFIWKRVICLRQLQFQKNLFISNRNKKHRNYCLFFVHCGGHIGFRRQLKTYLWKGHLSLANLCNFSQICQTVPEKKTIIDFGYF